MQKIGFSDCRYIMIQRIQTLYLLIIVALTTATLFVPLATVRIDADFYSFEASGLNTMTKPSELVYPTWALMVLPAAITIIASITIFLYKKRMLQIRFCIFNAFLLIGFYGLFAYFIWRMTGISDSFSFNVRIALPFPLICLILDYLAIRNIGADEILVRSLNRLRK